MKVKLIFLITILLCIYFTPSENYCKINKEHTMCKYQKEGPKCYPLRSSGIEPDEIKKIVNLHNNMRRYLAKGKELRSNSGLLPIAGNMIKMGWDREIQDVAQRWADQCENDHDKYRDLKRFSLGQNILLKDTEHNNWSWLNVFNAWYNEIMDINPDLIQSYEPSNKTANVANIIWHNIYAIGCGRRTFSKGTIYVCNYGPNAVASGKKIYERGEPCSKCPPKFYCQDALCVNTNNSIIAREDENFPRNLASLFNVAT